MNEAENILQHELAYMRQGDDSIGMLYADFIGKLQKRYDNLEGRHNAVLQEKEKLKVLADLLKKQNEQLLNEVNELNARLEAEKANNLQMRHNDIILTEKELPDLDDSSYPRVNNRKQRPQSINPDTIKRLKSDRRHYAVVCDAALFYWQRLVDHGLVNQYLKPTPLCGVTVAARIVCCFQNVVDPSIKWSFFEKHWGMKHLQSNLHRSSYRDEKKYTIVNRIFGRADDAPFVPKSQIDNQ